MSLHLESLHLESLHRGEIALPPAYAIVAMAAVLAGSVRAPLTALQLYLLEQE
ncbi:hypothetical protein HJG54_26340 [Leptolyngbya sp. NK1-12]|uniref:Uncharacterized protein n=1 Tax=Leptolyngbya sp. NK1-12 TaxID=2547451 RepID=A0AA96WRS1_9CYAN|nr:hypothetical protein [Leptolyngbya sp. NK1-12]WNZ21402.1 hypothetical protein HJG54_26340 [Leptolyngbya sp. NK1-12]